MGNRPLCRITTATTTTTNEGREGGREGHRETGRERERERKKKKKQERERDQDSRCKDPKLNGNYPEYLSGADDPNSKETQEELQWLLT